MENLKYAIILMVLAVCFSSCSKKGPEGHEEPVNLIGKWKLEKENFAWCGEVRDYSKNNIVYEFHPNGVLTVTGTTDDKVSERYKPGEYLYAILDADEYSEYLSPYVFEKNAHLLKIDNIIFLFRHISSKEKLMENWTYCDASSFILKKIN